MWHVKCTGVENKLARCVLSDAVNCDEYEGAGVVCSTDGKYERLNVYCNQNIHYKFSN